MAEEARDKQAAGDAQESADLSAAVRSSYFSQGECGGAGEAQADWEKRKETTLEWLYNPSTVEEVQQLGYPSYATVKRKLDALRKQKLIKRLGEIQWNANGRPLDVYGIWSPGKHLKHEVLLSKFLLPRWLAGWRARRGFDVDKTYRADAELVALDGETYFAEMDRSTEPMWQLKKRLGPYGRQDRLVLFIAEHERRVRQLLESMQHLRAVLLVTTLAEGKGKAACNWLDMTGKSVNL